MTKQTLHVVSLPHTQTTSEYVACAYTQKVVKFCTMMKSLGYRVILYAGTENEADCDEFVTIVSDDQKRLWFGDYDFHRFFFNITWDRNDDHWRQSNAKAAYEIRKRSSRRDIICLIGGVCQQDIALALPELMCVEFGIGYSGVFAPFKVWESNAWMHHVYGMMGQDVNGKFFDMVIPNYFDPIDFEFNPNKEDYYLFIGRVIKRKGIEIAVKATKDIGVLKVAGQGAVFEDDLLVADDITLSGDHIDFVGYANKRKRSDLLSKAKAVFVPTLYIEPFGGVNVEAQLCGTPVVTTDFGAFTETVEDGVTGFRCHTLGEFRKAAQDVGQLDPHYIRDRAEKLYSMNSVRYMYDKFFWRLSLLWEEGWYSNKVYQ